MTKTKKDKSNKSSIDSKYKFFGGYGLMLGMNILIPFMIFQIITNPDNQADFIEQLSNKNSFIGFLLVIGLSLFFIRMFFTQCRLIKINEYGITFINPIFRSIQKTTLWADFDYYILVEEASKYDTYEAVWLMKDGKIKGRFSSYYYSNYFDLKKHIKLKSYGNQNIGKFAQLFKLLGLKKIKID